MWYRGEEPPTTFTPTMFMPIIDEFIYEFRPYKYMSKIKSKKITQEDDYITKDAEIKRKVGKKFDY